MKKLVLLIVLLAAGILCMTVFAKKTTGKKDPVKENETETGTEVKKTSEAAGKKTSEKTEKKNKPEKTEKETEEETETVPEAATEEILDIETIDRMKKQKASGKKDSEDVESLSESLLEEETEEEKEKDPLITGIRDRFLTQREAAGQRWAVYIERLNQEEEPETDLTYHGDFYMQSASVIKVFIMGAVYDRVCYPSDPSKEIPYADNGRLRSLLEAMITVSDNDASNALVEILGGGDFVAGANVVYDFCMEHGYEHTSIGRRFLDPNPQGDNFTCADDCGKILSDIYYGRLVCEEASEKMLGLLKGQNVRHKIPAGLPSGFTSGNKTGEMPEGYGLGCIENDIAIVFSPKGDYVLCVLSNDLGGDNGGAQQTITQISSYVAQEIYP